MANQSKARRYTPEFRRDAVATWRQSDKAKSVVARELGIDPATLSAWIQQDAIDTGKQAGLTTAEREELQRLRKENVTLQMERDLMKKAAAFFANDATR